MFTLAYAEVVQVSSSYNQTNVAESSALVTREVAPTPYGASLGVEVRPGPVEPSAPYPTLPHLVE